MRNRARDKVRDNKAGDQHKGHVGQTRTDEHFRGPDKGCLREKGVYGVGTLIKNIESGSSWG